MTATALVITAVTGLLMALGGGIAWLVRRRDRKRDPIPKATAEVALAQQSLAVVSASRDALGEDLQRVTTDRASVLERLDQLEADRTEDRRRLKRLETLLSDAAGYIEAMLRAWPWTLLRPPPLPSTLHELIDPRLLRGTNDPKEG